MKGFVRIPRQLFEQLTPTEILLYYAIEHFHFTDRGCYASRETLMKLSSIKCNRRYAKAMKRLVDGGFIVIEKGNRYTLVERDGVGVYKAFLFNPEYTATEKLFNILLHISPNMNQKELARRLQVHPRTIQRCRCVSKIEVIAGEGRTKTQEGSGQKRNPSNLKSQVIKNTTYINLLGEQDKEPEETNPEVVISWEQEKAKQEAIKAETLIAASTEANSLDLFTELPEYDKLFQELRQVFKNAPEGQIQQAVYHTIKSTKRVKSTLFAYAYGILKQNLKAYGNRHESPTIRSVNQIRLEILALKNTAHRKEQVRKAQVEASQEEDLIISKNQAFLDSLPEEMREKVEIELIHIGNPLNLPFIPDAFAKTAGLAMKDMKEKIEALLWSNQP